MKTVKQEQLKKNFELFPTIDSEEKALKLINDAVWVGIAIAGINFIGALVLIFFLDASIDLGISFIINALIFLIFSLMLKFTKNWISASLNLIIAILSIVMTFLARIKITQGGTNIFLALFYLLWTYNGFRATLYLRTHKKYKKS